MKFFNHHNLDLDWAAFKLVKDQYWRHIAALRSRMPGSLYEFHQTYSMHDASLLSVTDLQTRPDAIFVLDGCRNGHVADSDRVVFVLHLMNVYYDRLTIGRWLGKELLYTEIDCTSNGRWEMTCLFLNFQEELVVEFEGFGHYVHNALSPY